MTRVFIALGSNINPEYNIQELPSARCQLLAVSPVYETVPVGKTDQPSFLNAAALIETDLTAAELKTQVLQVIEQELGRRAPGARTGELNTWSSTRAHH